MSISASRAEDDFDEEFGNGSSDSKPIDLAHVSNSSSETSPGNASKTEVSTSSTISSSKVGSSNRSRLPISILPDDPEEAKTYHWVNISLVHTTIILTKQYSGPAIIISHMGFGDIYANPSVIFIDLQGDQRSDEMQCVIASEDPGISYSCEIYK
ncbi:hypothetical protein F8M41_006388 [Gigaspora margarita]|nr:hypothetical protein F8M41_006388 [Gigaspora margarita]